MRLEDLLDIVETSSPDDWQRLPTPTLYRWSEGNNGKYEPVEFDDLHVYRDDVDIALLMAQNTGSRFEEPWVTRFPDKKAEAVTVALRYRGSIVQQWPCVMVDGDRYCLLLPDAVEDGFVFPKKKLPLARLLFALHDGNPVTAAHFGPFLKQAGIRVA